jgi:hypothetical protein
MTSSTTSARSSSTVHLGRLFRRARDGTVETVLSELHFVNCIALTLDEGSLV